MTETEERLIIRIIDGQLTQLGCNARAVLFQLIANMEQGQTGMGKPGVQGDDLYLHDSRS